MHNQGIRYIFFGGCTTMVNLVSYWIFRNLIHIDVTRANFFCNCPVNFICLCGKQTVCI